jgi:hypothetical protein
VLKVRHNLYACRSRKKSDGPGTKAIYMHRAITNCPEGLQPDHKDGDGLNNRQKNLRITTHARNQRGFKRKRLGSSSKFRGVVWYKAYQKWQVQLSTDGVRTNVGYFDSEEDAAKAYEQKALELGVSREALNFHEALPEAIQEEA